MKPHSLKIYKKREYIKDECKKIGLVANDPYDFEGYPSGILHVYDDEDFKEIIKDEFAVSEPLLRITIFERFLWVCMRKNKKMFCLSGKGWKSRVKGFILLAYHVRQQTKILSSIGGFGAITEKDQWYNDFNRNIIESYKIAFPNAVIGSINTFGGKAYEPVPGKIYNFGCVFVIPYEDFMLKKMILGYRSEGSKAQFIDSIQNRIDEIGGFRFVWF